LTGCGDSSNQLRNGDQAPGFELSRLAGGPLGFPAALQGRVVVIRFWADWCPFCESEMSAVEPVYLAHREKGLEVLAINVRQDRKTAEKFTERIGISYEVLLDSDGEVARRYGVVGLPTTFFIDREGRIATRILGESTPELLQRVLGDLL